MAIKAIIFDLDGTLLYTLEDLKNSVNYSLLMCKLKPRTLDEIRNFVGNGIYKLIERSVGENVDKIPECFEIFKKHYAKNCTVATVPYDNTVEILKKIKDKGVRIAVLSNKADFAVKYLVDFYFKNIIDISMGETGKFPKKPNPSACLNIIKSFNLNKNEVILTGDSEVDIQTAKNAGIKCISALWGYKDKDFLIKHGAKTFINSIDEILGFL